ncbi:MAG: gamma-glutamylcyclotransferase family protein [Pseudomonadota bacterium]
MLRLFVYGTLAPGRRNHHVVSDIPGDWEVASMCGDLVDEGWGAAMGCPAIVPRADGPAVEGFVFRSPDLDAHWPRLDAFEGEAYERTTVVVTLGSGEQVEAQVYALRDTGR